MRAARILLAAGPVATPVATPVVAPIATPIATPPSTPSAVPSRGAGTPPARGGRSGRPRRPARPITPMPVVPRTPAAPAPRAALLPLVGVALVAGVAASAATVALTRGLAPDPVAASGPVGPPGTSTASVADAGPAPVPLGPVPTGEPSDDDRAGGSDPRIAELVAGLEAARAERSRLAETLVGLSREVGELTDAVGAVNLPGGDAPDPEAAAPADALAGGGGGRGGDAPDDDPLAGLVAAGLDPASAADLRRRQDEYQLARLELVDQAAREGWEDSDAFEQRLEELDGAAPDLRSELGDDGYDRYLFESGARNRVGIEAIIPGSAAASAGLQVGDVVLGYADGRVFAPGDLQDATRSGTRGEPVTVLAERDGRNVEVQVPRGPLGITLDRIRREP